MPYHILAFDSGIGGLGVVQNLQQQLKDTSLQVSIDYLADTLVFPYGEQEDPFLVDRILTLMGQAIERLHPDLIIIACNTGSTIALAALRERYPSTVFVGCVPPIRWAARISQTKHIGLLATKATVKRSYLQGLKEQFAPDCKLIAYGSSELARLAENYFRYQRCNLEQVNHELNLLFQAPEADKIDTVCLGCTHYPFLLDIFKAHTPSYIEWLDPAIAVARHTIDILSKNEIKPSSVIRNNRFYSTAPLAEENTLLQRLKPMGYDTFHIF